MIGARANDKNIISMFSNEKPAAVEAMTHFSLFACVNSLLLVCSIFNSSKMKAHGPSLFCRMPLCHFLIEIASNQKDDFVIIYDI